MALNLPEPREDPLARSPLKLVVCELRYTVTPAASRFSVARAVQEVFAAEGVWQLNQVEQRTFAITPDAPSVVPTTVESQTAWQLTSVPGGWTVTIKPNSVALETTRYEGWRHFSPRFASILPVIREVAAPEAAGRLGLRYVDRIEDPRVTSPAEWERWIQPEVLGITRLAGVGPAVVAAQQQVGVDAGDDLRATVRHGFSRDEDLDSLPYVMDFDAYREGAREFDVEGIHADLGRLHRLAVQLFQHMITDALYQYLRGAHERDR